MTGFRTFLLASVLSGAVAGAASATTIMTPPVIPTTTGTSSAS
jgi:hypothetical protein